MRVVSLLLFGLSACTVPAGQRISAQLLEETLECASPGDGAPPVAVLELDREDDLYVAEVQENATGRILALPGERAGTTVTFTCPAGLGSFVVRRAIIQNAERKSEAEQATPPGPSVP